MLLGGPFTVGGDIVNIANGASELHSPHPKVGACLWLSDSHSKLH